MIIFSFILAKLHLEKFNFQIYIYYTATFYFKFLHYWKIALHCSNIKSIIKWSNQLKSRQIIKIRLKCFDIFCTFLCSWKVFMKSFIYMSLWQYSNSCKYIPITLKLIYAIEVHYGKIRVILKEKENSL